MAEDAFKINGNSVFIKTYYISGDGTGDDLPVNNQGDNSSSIMVFDGEKTSTDKGISGQENNNGSMDTSLRAAKSAATSPTEAETPAAPAPESADDKEKVNNKLNEQQKTPDNQGGTKITKMDKSSSKQSSVSKTAHKNTVRTSRANVRKTLETRTEFLNDVTQEEINDLKAKIPSITTLIDKEKDKSTLAKNINKLGKNLDDREMEVLGNYVYTKMFNGNRSQAINFLKKEASALKDDDLKNGVLSRESFVKGFAARGGIRINTYKAELNWFKNSHSEFAKALENKSYDDLLNYIADNKDTIKKFDDKERRVMYNYLCKTRNLYTEKLEVNYKGTGKQTRVGTQEEADFFKAYKNFDRRDELPHGFYSEVFYVRGSRPSADPTFEKLDNVLGGYWKAVDEDKNTPNQVKTTPVVSEAQEHEAPTTVQPQPAPEPAKMLAEKKAIPNVNDIAKQKGQDPKEIKNPVKFYHDNIILSFNNEKDIKNAFKLATAEIEQPKVKNTFWIHDHSVEETMMKMLEGLRTTNLDDQNKNVKEILKYREDICKMDSEKNIDKRTFVGINKEIVKTYEEYVDKITDEKLKNFAQKKLKKLKKQANKANKTWINYIYNKPSEKKWNNLKQVIKGSNLYKAVSKGKFDGIDYENYIKIQ